MQLRERKPDNNSFKLLLDEGELQKIYDNLQTSDIKKQVGVIIDSLS